MNIIEIDIRTPKLLQELLNIWEDSVRATHLFLSSKEIEKIKTYVPQALEIIDHLIIIEDEKRLPVGFMGIENQKLEMLFIQSSERGKGLGKQLLNYAIKKFDVNELTVNEQNPLAKGFYEHMGFVTYKRTDLDEQGNPYPVLYMSL